MSEIYTRLTTNATTTEGGHSFTFSDSATGTHYTLTQIYNAIPTIVANTVKLDISYLGVTGTLVPSGGNAAAINVLSGKTFFGDAQTNWTPQVGTMTNNGSFSLTASSTDQSVTVGYYSGGTLAGDANLAVGNIKSGITIFGSDGTLITNPLFGDNTSSTVLTTAANPGSYLATNLTPANVRNTIAFGVGQTGTFAVGYTYGSDNPIYVLTNAVGTPGSFNISNLSDDKIKKDTTWGVSLGSTGALTPDGGTSTVADLFSGKTAHLTADWTLDTGTLNLACNTATFDGAGNLVADAYDGAGNGANRWCMATSTNSAAASQILSGYKSWANGIELTGSISTQTLSAATTTVSAGYYNATTVDAVDTDLAAGNIKSGVNIFGVNGSVSASYNYALQRYQVYDDWNCSGNNGEGTAACGGGDAEYTGEEGTWTLTNTDASPPAGIASGKVYQDARTLLYWADYFTATTSNSFTIDCTDEAINNGTCDYNSYATKGNAITLCDNLSLDADGGVQETDWRLPTQKELMQAYIDGAANNLPNPGGRFWSSTENYNNTAFAWHVNLGFGYPSYTAKTIGDYARCVRP